MIFIFLIVGLAIAVITYVTNFEEKENYDKKRKRRIGYAISIFLIVGSIVFMFQIPLHRYKETQKTGEYEIVSIQESSQVHGEVKVSRYIGKGRIDTEEYYIFYYRDGDCYKRGKISIEDAVVHEKDYGKPEIIEYTRYTYTKMGNAILDFLAMDGSRPEKRYEIFVPRETIAQNLQ